MNLITDNSCNSVSKVFNFDYGVVGLGRTGCAIIEFLSSKGFSILGADSRVRPPNIDAMRERYSGIPILLGGTQFDLLTSCAEIILSPGVDSRKGIFASLRARGQKIKGDIEIFAEYVDAPVIGITGTNGKSTVTTMVSSMLEAAGVKVRSGGNLGTPAVELLTGGPPDCYVLELSSFQLELVEHLNLDVACILNVAPDHLDRHLSFDSYVNIKKKILKNSERSLINSEDKYLRYLENGQSIKGFCSVHPSGNGYGAKVVGGDMLLGSVSQDFVMAKELSLVGDHNLLNSIAALGVVDMYLGSVPELAIKALKAFRGLPHRGQVVGEKNGIQFIDDSKATNAAAAHASILGVRSEKSIVLIAGGAAKGICYIQFVNRVVSHLRAVVLLGETAPDLKKLFADKVDCIVVDTMFSAVICAMNFARKGDKVLLAPACSSVDMFDDYRHRGSVFQEAVATLGELS